MGILAKSSGQSLEKIWDQIDPKPCYNFLREPEIGLAMVRGRAGGVGQQFNLGGATITRSVIQLSQGGYGHAIILGSDERKAELAAVFDALLTNTEMRAELEPKIIQPLAETIKANHQTHAAKTAATKVDFYTLVRGED
jgi:alpha-D-ribose 1-methylphosphonate 5-triphosphate synthase subunit PhnG